MNILVNMCGTFACQYINNSQNAELNGHPCAWSNGIVISKCYFQVHLYAWYGVLIHMSFIWIFVMAGGPSYMAKMLALGITSKLFNQIFSYLPCL